MSSMASRILTCTLLALLACNTLALPEAAGRELLQKRAGIRTSTGAESNTRKGRASARSNLRVEDGEGLAAARAEAQAIEKAADEVKDIVKEVIKDFPERGDESKEEYCGIVSTFLEDEALAIGTAAAEVTVDTFGIVEIDGVGSGCTATAAEASAQALATVDLVVTAWAEVKRGVNVATAQARLRGATSVLVEAAASATANACSESDGSAPAFAEAFQTVVAKAYAKAVASILVFLEASIDCAGETDVFAEAEVGATIEDETTIVDADGGSTVEGRGEADTTAEADATTTQVTPCRREGLVRLCCRSKNTAKGMNVCYCNLAGRSRGKPACATRKQSGKKTLWQFEKNGEQKTCEC